MGGQSLRDSNGGSHRHIVVCWLSIAVLTLTLSACAGGPWIPFSHRNELKGMSRTVVYVTPYVAWKLNTFTGVSGLFLSGTAGSLAGFFAIAGFVAPPVDLLMVPLTLTAEESHHRYKAFATDIKPYGDEISHFQIPLEQEKMARRAIAAVPWLQNVAMQTIAQSKGVYFLRKTALREDTQATIFIVPRGVWLSYDAKTLTVSYGVVVYIKDPRRVSKVREFDSETFDTVRTIAYPYAVEHFNPLTAPTNDPVAWRVKVLFSNNGALFVGSLKEMLQAEQWKLTCFFVGSCVP